MARKRPMTTEELFNMVSGILKEKGKLPDILDYGLATHSPVAIKNYEYGLKNKLDYGGNEGIYLDMWIEYTAEGKKCAINAVKYSDIDYVNRTLSVERQLGKELDRTPHGKTKGMTKCELPLKTPSSRRILPIPDYVFEAILEERKKYEKWRSRRKSVFHDDGYICCSNFSGKPRSKDFHWRHYKELLKRTGLPDIRWHDLRSTYCTLLLNNDFSPEAVSRLMGHAGELITIDVYGDNTNIIPEEIPELISYMDEVMPKKTLQGIDSETDGKGVLDTLIDMEEFFPEKAVKSDV